MPVDFTVLPKVLPDGSEALMSEDTTAATADQTNTTAAPEQDGQEDRQAETPPADSAAPAPEADTTPALVEIKESTPGTISTTSTSEDPDTFVLTLKATAPVADMAYMNLSDPKRLAVDLLGIWTFKGDNVIRTNGVVKHVVVGEHADKLRLVIYFNTSPKGKLQPVFTQKGDNVTISVPLR
ncbi:hypothetical protein PSDVSF_25140 [Pseudodesulfovibrio sediminis]|uniref:AMIN domain-containing protein n=2 Tax=Pseudodesulfovibrio sediminis TaxID=2810563 RepID=A0ABN6EUS9_9BACT|nr:hypothetical protein PSDVSF_25140 [Pseudodesulfovibrio sediminis]